MKCPGCESTNFKEVTDDHHNDQIDVGVDCLDCGESYVLIFEQTDWDYA